MTPKNLRIVVFYAGDEATVPRDRLINWLRSSRLKAILHTDIEVRTAVDSPVHAHGHVSDRVAELIDWANKCFAVISPDRRSRFGGANVIDEMATWKAKKGPDSLCVIRAASVPAHSNIAGEIYLSYENDIVSDNANKEKLLQFLALNYDAESLRIIDHTELGPALMELAQVFSKEHLRVLLYSGESFKLFTDTFTSPSFMRITLLTRNWYVEREEEKRWNQQVRSIRPWEKSSRMEQWHRDLDLESTRGLTIERRFYKAEPNLFLYLFGDQAGIFSYYRRYPTGTLPLDVFGNEGGSRFKAWFFPLLEVRRTSRLGERTLDSLMLTFTEFEKSCVPYKEMLTRFE
jgi:hypothetical protein